MGFVNSSTLPLSSADTTTTVINKITVADTETSEVLPANTKGFLMRSRNGSDIQIAYNSGDSGSLYFTVKGRAVYNDSNFYTSQTVYFQTVGAADTVEIIIFS